MQEKPSPPSNGLKFLALRATMWSGAEGAITALLGFAVAIALARLVSPIEFGIAAIVLALGAVANVIIDFGIGAALIQRRDFGPREETAAFHFNLGLSGIVGLALVLLAPAVSRFFGHSELEKLCWLMALNLVLGACGSIHTTLLSKALNFRLQMLIGVVAVLLSGVVAIALAARGYGVWALAWQAVIQSLVASALLWYLHPWRPSARFDPAALRRLLAFGSHWMMARLVDTIYTRFFVLLVGKLYSTAELGQYVRAYSTQQLPTNLLTRVISRVALPAFAMTSDDPERLANALSRSMRVLMRINLPAMVGLALVAEPLVLVLFGRQWLPSAPLLSILALAGTLWPMHVLNINALAAQGQAPLLLKMEFAKKSIGLLAAGIASFWGLEAIAWSQVISGAVAFAINAHFSGRFMGFGIAAQLRSIGGLFLPTIAMTTVVLTTGELLALGPISELAIQTIVGAATFLSSGLMLGEFSIQELRRTIQSIFAARRNDA